MTIGRMFGVSTALLLASLQSQAQTVPFLRTPPADVKVQQVDLMSVDPAQLVFTAKLGLYPEKSVTLTSLSFSAMTVNGAPVYVAPLTGKFALKKGELLQLPDVRITVYTRDLVSLQPAIAAVQEEKVTVEGEITASLEGGLLEDLALHSLHPKVVLPFKKEMPVLIPGGDMGRQAALATLTVLSQVTPQAAKLLGVVFPGEDGAWRNDLTKNQVKHIVLVHTSYAVTDGKTSYPMEFDELGFWIGASSAMVTEEAIRPWEFDPDAQARMKASKAKVQDGSVAISVRPLSPGDAEAEPWLLSKGDFTVLSEGKPAEGHYGYSDKAKSMEVRERVSPGNFAILRFRDGIAGDPVKAASAEEKKWDRLGVFHLIRAAGSGSVRAEVVFLPATSDGKQIAFGQPIDESAFGSPVMSPDGAIALVQNEGHATMLTVFKHLDEKAK
jgi:hypothetical protein